MASRVNNNEGIGSDEITMMNLTTTVAASLARPIRQADIDAGRDAVVLVANNQVAYCTTTRAFFGKAVAVSNDLTAKGEPVSVTVQVAGVMSLNGTTTLPTTAAGSIICRAGKVMRATSTTARQATGGACRIPRVINVWDTDRINVIL